MKKSTFLKIVTAQIETEKSYILEHEEIKEILKPLEGEVFTHKILNVKRLKNLRFSQEYGMYCIIGKYSHLVGYNTNPIINIENFEKFDACHGYAAAERIEKLNTMNKDEFFKLFNEIEKTFKKLRLLFGAVETEKFGAYHNPIYYSVINTMFEDVSDQQFKNILPSLLHNIRLYEPKK
jgi:hypothetical protein